MITTAKLFIKLFVPKFIIEHINHHRRRKEQKLNQGRTAEEVFTDIYETNKWGGVRGEYSSGSGSTNTGVVSAYVSRISEIATREDFSKLKFVDLGCGDFRVGIQLAPLCSEYFGVDVVEPLIVRNQDRFGTSSIHFIHLDIVNDDLPEGEVCFVRQVLQHLSNQQILSILRKLHLYKWVFITEHYPTDNPEIKPNIDKVHGCDVRVEWNSGVYLTKPPFNLPEKSIEKVFEVPGTGLEAGKDQGVIRTFLYRPAS